MRVEPSLDEAVLSFMKNVINSEGPLQTADALASLSMAHFHATGYDLVELQAVSMETALTLSAAATEEVPVEIGCGAKNDDRTALVSELPTDTAEPVELVEQAVGDGDVAVAIVSDATADVGVVLDEEAVTEQAALSGDGEAAKPVVMMEAKQEQAALGGDCEAAKPALLMEAKQEQAADAMAAAQVVKDTRGRLDLLVASMQTLMCEHRSLTDHLKVGKREDVARAHDTMTTLLNTLHETNRAVHRLHDEHTAIVTGISAAAHAEIVSDVAKAVFKRHARR